MRSFEWCEPASLDEALADLAPEGALAKAGGLDLLHRMKGRLDAPPRLVSLRRVAGLDALRAAPDGALELGALATLARLAADPAVQARWPALAQAAAQVATPNVRNAATVAGNLLQRPRCWYFRNEAFRCLRRGGTTCYAQEGRNAYHAVLANGTCAMVHPSDLAVPLVALDAEVELAARGGRRAVPLESLFVAPDEDPTREHRLPRDELVVAVRVPSAPRARAGWVKLRERESADWPLASAAAVLEVDGDRCVRASIVLGAASPVPWRARAAEALLVGKPLDPPLLAEAARAAVAGARPLAENAHKVRLLEVAARRALEAARGAA